MKRKSSNRASRVRKVKVVKVLPLEPDVQYVNLEMEVVGAPPIPAEPVPEEPIDLGVQPVAAKHEGWLNWLFKSVW